MNQRSLVRIVMEAPALTTYVHVGVVGSLSGSTSAFLTLAGERCITWAMWRGP